MSTLRTATIHDKAEFNKVENLYTFLLPELKKKFPGHYFLVHTPTLKSSVGTGSETVFPDAVKRHLQHHGHVYGQYFGVIIPDSNGD